MIAIRLWHYNLNLHFVFRSFQWKVESRLWSLQYRSSSPFSCVDSNLWTKLVLLESKTYQGRLAIARGVGLPLQLDKFTREGIIMYGWRNDNFYLFIYYNNYYYYFVEWGQFPTLTSMWIRPKFLRQPLTMRAAIKREFLVMRQKRRRNRKGRLFRFYHYQKSLCRWTWQGQRVS